MPGLATTVPLGDRSRPPTPPRPVVVLTGPALEAVSGVSSHLELLLGSRLCDDFTLCHFRVGSEGRNESVAARARRLLHDPVRLFHALRRRRAAVLHVNSSLNARAYWRDVVFLAVARLARVPTLLQIHGGALPQEFYPRSRILTGCLRLTLRMATHIVVLGRDELAAWRRFLPGTRIDAVPNAIDTSVYGADRAAPGRPDDILELLFLGRLAPGKGLDELLAALAAPGSSRLRLTIAGSGPEEAQLRERVAALGLVERVRFAGAVSGTAKHELLCRSDLFVLPSYSEGLPYALLEAMASGAAVVATPVGAIPDVVTDGVHGRLVPPRDTKALARALEELAGRPARLARMRRACRARVRRAFDIGTLEHAFADIYSGLVPDRVTAARVGPRVRG